MIHRYHAFFLDAYGVFWAGNAAGLIPGAKEAMERLVSLGKRVGVVSNATQFGEREIAKVEKAGLLLGKHFHFYLTSGDVLKALLLEKRLPFKTPHQCYHLVSPPHPKYQVDRLLFEGSGFESTDDPSLADFLYISVPHIDGEDQVDPGLFSVLVKELARFKKPVLCANPDHFAHEGNPPRAVVRQGALAALFEQEGADVFYVGKPSSLIFEEALKRIEVAKEHILMVGDTPETDIRGANAFGIDSALITDTGLSKGRTLSTLQDQPTYSFPCLSSIPT